MDIMAMPQNLYPYRDDNNRAVSSWVRGIPSDAGGGSEATLISPSIYGPDQGIEPTCPHPDQGRSHPGHTPEPAPPTPPLPSGEPEPDLAEEQPPDGCTQHPTPIPSLRILKTTTSTSDRMAPSQSRPFLPTQPQTHTPPLSQALPLPRRRPPPPLTTPSDKSSSPTSMPTASSATLPARPTARSTSISNPQTPSPSPPGNRHRPTLDDFDRVTAVAELRRKMMRRGGSNRWGLRVDRFEMVRGDGKE
ncbi:hypothetical protein VTK26DRAFT_5476 [Humicola hyalothermophila]